MNAASTSPEFHTVNYDGLTVRYTNDPAPVAKVKELNMAYQEPSIVEILRGELRNVKKELQAVLDDWNDLVKAIGSSTNGVAIGYAKALRADAENYRWLIDHFIDHRCLSVGEWLIIVKGPENYCSDDDLDAAIDAARKEGSAS